MNLRQSLRKLDELLKGCEDYNLYEQLRFVRWQFHHIDLDAKTDPKLYLITNQPKKVQP